MLWSEANPTYVIMVDDVKKDEQIHHYEWLLSVPSDVHLAAQWHSDVVLQDDSAKDDFKAPLGTRRLLVSSLAP
jgi:hypothetical protein